MKKTFFFAALSTLLLGCGGLEQYPDGQSINQSFAPDGIPFTFVADDWAADSLGNHRAVVEVTDASKPALAVLPWRRADLRVDEKMIKVIAAADSIEVRNVYPKSITSDAGQVVFEPTQGAGTYYIYYMPYRYRKGWDDARYGKPWNDYLTPAYSSDSLWVAAVKANPEQTAPAKVRAFESRSKFDFLTPMGVIATQKEVDSMRAAHAGKNPVLFLEDRVFPIRLKNHLPYRWTKNAVHDNFQGGAMRNEYYVWQVGVWAAHAPLQGVKIQFSDLTNGSAVIPKKEITCFNQEGVNWDGKPLAFHINVDKDQVQALWCGVQIPKEAKTGTYTGTATISADGVEPQTVHYQIEVFGTVLADQGDGDLWRHARLRWLNSTIGSDSLPVAPYAPMELANHTISATGKQVVLNANGLIEQANINDKQLLTAPMSFRVQTAQGAIVFAAQNLQTVKTADGLVEWSATSEQQGVIFALKASMEYDGYIRYNIKVGAQREMAVKEVALVSDFTPYGSKYFMGAGFAGGLCPKNYVWNWVGPYDSFWIGNDKIGAHIELRGGTYHGPLINDYKPAPSPVWSNQGKGTVRVDQTATQTQVIASTGAQTIGPKELDFEFSVLLTPVKPIDTKKHFSERYYHNDEAGFDQAAKEGANIVNIHHSRKLNPVINYPFVVTDSLVAYINHQHENDRKVKLYYTIREQSNYTHEIYALMSLGNEIFAAGPGYGTPWHMEHLIDGYKAAWYTELPNQHADAALVLSGFSRWINYYLEGLRWMYENYKIDGIYMDDVSFDRTVMKRMRKLMAEYRPTAVIDLHSNTGYSIGPANQYTDFFPYVDRLWFGESFRYNQMTPDEWFVTFSGIPFGQMSEMLQDGGNRFLGMVYGATGRHSYIRCSPAPVWALWQSFGIEQAQMLGYWDEACPVKTNNELVKATAFVKEGKTLVSVGNFSDKAATVTLTYDLKAMGLDPAKLKIETPAVKNFQAEATIQANQPLTINPKEGLLLVLSN